MTLQLAIDCTDPARLVEFWGPALGYLPAPPPRGHDTWNDYYRSVGVPEDELLEGVDACDRLIDPSGNGPNIWFQIVPEGKTVKNRLHLDLLIDGARDLELPQRRAAVERRVAELVEAGATVLYRMGGDTVDHYGVTLADPEGNEFCIARRRRQPPDRDPAPASPPESWSAIARSSLALAPSSHCWQMSASCSPRSHRASESSRDCPPLSSFATMSRSSARACS